MEEGRHDYRLLLHKALRYWYIYIFFGLVAGMGAFAYLKYTPPKYKAEALMLIQDEENVGRINEEAVFADLGLGKAKDNLVNEIMVFTSKPLMREVVRKLELQYRYISINGMLKRELYKDAPIQVLNWEPRDEHYTLYGVLSADRGGGYRFKVDDSTLGEKNVFSGEFGRALELPMGKLTLTRIQGYPLGEETGVLVLPVEAMAAELISNLEVRRAADRSSIISLVLKDVVPNRIKDVLETLIAVYNQNSISDKNHVYENTIDLINERIGYIVQELSAAEQDVEAYKQRFSMTELSAEGTLLMNELSSYNREISGTDVQLEILNSIEGFLEQNRNNFEFVPTNLSITNLTLANQLESFNRLLAERERMRSDLGPSHPDMVVTEKQLRNLRQTIVENINSIKRDLIIARNASQSVRSGLQGRLQSLPRRERELIEIERRKGVKENLYLYLLQKREESAISLAVTSAKGKVVEPPEAPVAPVSPISTQIWLIAAFLGLALPTGFIFLLYYTNDKILVEDDIESVTAVPMAGMIAQSRRKTRLVVKEDSRSVSAEMFRMLRANLAYIGSGKDLKSLLITSGISGEGKSFIALNLGVIQALAGKKTIILELDLRKPKQEVYSDAVSSEMGVVNYLVDVSIIAEDIIVNSGVHPNLDLIRCGPKPPNPSELILLDRLRELVNVLRARYDFIILDAPPVGLVADALQMHDLADATMFVLRAGYSRRPEVGLINDIAEKGKLPRPFIVLNGVKMNGGSNGYGYGYRYGYGYGYGYTSNKEKAYHERE
jgi:tyrosine-protein kinase Etk/Wzc